MPSYLIVDVSVKDPARYADYIRQVPAVIARHGGEYLVRGGAVDVIEGDWTPSRLVVMRFPTREALQGYLDDPDYAPLRDLRREVADSIVIAADGLR
jgi:uncharacterized protein (DUF1330 family)